MDLVHDAMGLKAFADQQGVNMDQLKDLARILNQGEVSIGQAIKQLERWNDHVQENDGDGPGARSAGAGLHRARGG